jgi:capsular polysaccharide biosynthesis protein
MQLKERLKPAVSRSPTKVVQVAGGSLWTDSELNNCVFDGSNRIVANLCTCINPERANDFNAGHDIFIPPQLHKFDELPGDHPKTFLRGTVANLSCFNVAAVSYGHWLTDVLPRLALYLAEFDVREIDKFYFPSARWPWQIETLRLLGIEECRVISEEKVKSFSCDLLLTTPFPRPGWDVPDWIPEALKVLFGVSFPANKTLSRKFYATRKDAKWRKVRNESDLEAALAREGFEILTLADFTLEEKMKLFAETSMVVSMHGSSLGNTLFCQENAGVLEMFGPGQTSPLHRQIADCIPLRYRSIQFSEASRRPDDHLEAAFGDVDVDVGRVLAALEDCL